MIENYNNGPNYEQYRSPETLPPGKPETFYKSPAPQKKVKNKRGVGGVAVAAIVVAASIFGGVIGGGGTYLFMKNSPDVSEKSTTAYESSRPHKKIELKEVKGGEKLSTSELYANCVNSVVGITTSGSRQNVWGLETPTATSGSGLVVSSDGYIVTNYHVIEGSNEIKVNFYDNSTLPAEVVGYDPSNDLAVLKVKAKDLSPVVLGDSSKLNVGDDVATIGNPLGELTFSITGGIVSALNREVSLQGVGTMDLIQTDTAINSGNSGGPLFNMYGEVVGVTNAKYSGVPGSGMASIDNIGFAIPINTVKSIIKDIIETGVIKKPYIGVQLSGVSAETQSYGIPSGAAVQEITPGGPAENSGLQVYDIITEAKGQSVKSPGDLVTIIKNCRPGEKVKLKVFRPMKSSGNEIELEVTVGERSQNAVPDKAE